MIHNIKPVKTFMGRLSHGADLLQELTDICIREKIDLGKVEGIGAVQKARIGYYDQESREYQFITYDQPLEITSLTGNVSIKDGSPFVHAHINLADDRGNTFGGHLAPGTILFACECIVQSFAGERLTRSHDDATGLPLWQA